MPGQAEIQPGRPRLAPPPNFQLPNSLPITSLPWRLQEIRRRDCLKDGSSTRLCCGGCAFVGSHSPRGPLRNAPGFLTKLFRLAAATLIAIGLLISLVWDPMLKNQQVFSCSYRDLDLALGLTPIVWVAWVIRTIFRKSHPNMTHRATVMWPAWHGQERQRVSSG